MVKAIIEIYSKEMLEPELKPEFIKELLEAQKEKAKKIIIEKYKHHDEAYKV